MLEEFDPTTIEDEDLRQVFLALMNLVETLHAKVQEQAEEIQRLRDENNRLKGEQGKPKIKPNKAATALSSEKERRQSKPHGKTSKQTQIRIDRVEVVQVEPERLPEDAQFKGYEEVIVQDIDFRTQNIKFRKEKYYSPAHKRTYLAELPAGYAGQFGPGVRAWVLALYYAGGMSEPKLLELLQTVGLQISAGELSDLLIKNQEQFHAERGAVLRAGLSSSPWHHLDSTGTRVNGRNEHCHVLCNPLYSAYCTLPSKDRLSLLRVLQGGADLSFRWNEEALSLLEQFGVAQKWCQQLSQRFSQEQEWQESQLDEWFDQHLPTLGTKPRKLIKDSLAIAAYHTQTTCPVIELLICDDAPQFDWLTAQLALCWVHEHRHYKKLTPCLPYHRQQLDQFQEHFWKLYRQLLVYRHHPNQKEADEVRREFERLFGQSSDYEQLDQRKALTLAKKDHLLMVLSHPEIPLHNNPAELGARQRVHKPDVSLQARTKEGIGAWDTFQTLVSTAKKLGVNIYQYFHDRVTQTNQFPSLATLIEERAKELQLAASWHAVT